MCHSREIEGRINERVGYARLKNDIKGRTLRTNDATIRTNNSLSSMGIMSVLKNDKDER